MQLLPVRPDSARMRGGPHHLRGPDAVRSPRLRPRLEQRRPDRRPNPPRRTAEPLVRAAPNLR